MMLMSNWDNKDVRDVARGSNTAIFEYRLAESATREARYLIIDWGAALGAWGNNILQRGRWDPEAFAGQNEQFITGVDGDLVQFGYQGQRTADITANITRADVALVRAHRGRLTDDHLRAALRASGANREEVDLFTAALRARLDQLRNPAAYGSLVFVGVDLPRWQVMQVTRASAPAARGTAASSCLLMSAVSRSMIRAVFFCANLVGDEIKLLERHAFLADMAELAADAEGVGKSLHRADDDAGGRVLWQHLQVLERRRRECVLGKQRRRAHQRRARRRPMHVESSCSSSEGLGPAFRAHDTRSPGSRESPPALRSSRGDCPFGPRTARTASSSALLYSPIVSAETRK